MSILISSVILFSEHLNKRMSNGLASLTRLRETDLVSSVSAEEFDICYIDAILDPASSDRDLSDIAQQEERKVALCERHDFTLETAFAQFADSSMMRLGAAELV